MKLNKTQWIIIAVLGAVAIWYFFLRKKKAESSYQAGVGTSPPARCPRGYNWDKDLKRCVPNYEN